MTEKQISELIELNDKILDQWAKTHDKNQKTWNEIKYVIANSFLLIGILQVITLVLIAYKLL